MTLMPEVRAALVEAATASAAPQPKRRGLSTKGLAVALVALAIGGSAVAATQWAPQLGDDQRGHPAELRSPVPTEISETLGVLRRPQTDRDRGPEVEAVLRTLDAENTDGILVDGVRLLMTTNGSAAVLVPVASGDEKSSLNPRILLAYLSDRPGLSNDETTRSVARVQGTPSSLQRDQLSLIAPAKDGFHLVGLVPDGVSGVVATFRSGRQLTSVVTNNAYDIAIGPSPEGASITWSRGL